MLSTRILPTLDQDMHIHSTFSDGAGTIGENLAAAEARGLTRVCLVDHVRASTTWAGEFASQVRRAAARTELDVSCGLEAKVLDVTGRLDLPADTGGADYVYVADHQVPLAGGPAHPAWVREALERGQLDPEAVTQDLVQALTGALDRADSIVIAHLFSVLPKIGLSEADVPVEALEELAAAAAAVDAAVEIDERWRCPSARTLRVFHDAGVRILLSTDSHAPETIGRYGYCVDVLERLRAEAAGS